jgi:hypothetical protein
MKDETGKVTFDADEQKEVDRIVQERLARAKTPEDYNELKEIEKELEEFGFKGTVSEKKAAIKAQREQYQKQAELEELQAQAKAEGTSPELLGEIKELKKEINELKGEREAFKKAEESKKQAQEAWNMQVKEMQETHPDVDLEKLAQNQKFLKFIKGKGLALKESYEDFVEFIGEQEAEIQNLRKKLTNEENSKSSTGSVKSQGTPQASYFTREQVAKMSDAEINRNWKAINESMKKW